MRRVGNDNIRVGLLRVTCPSCGGQMRLTRVDPDVGRRADICMYGCDCGDSFRLAAGRTS
jgi:hypothetical protein